MTMQRLYIGVLVGGVPQLDREVGRACDWVIQLGTTSKIDDILPATWGRDGKSCEIEQCMVAR
jgi:hypothetical protein